MEVIVDTDAMLRIMFTAHDSLQVPVFKVSVLPTLRPGLELGGVIQSLLRDIIFPYMLLIIVLLLSG